MRLRRVLAGAALGLGATAVANRALATRAGPLEPALDGRQHTSRWRGFDVAYAEAGDQADPDVVLYHGLHAAASSREFRALFDDLAEAYHVLAPDLPGFGRTARPPVTYTAGLYRAFLADFARDHATDPVVVATSLTGALAAETVGDAGASRLLLVCPTDDVGPHRPWLRRLLRSPVVGQGLFNLLVSRPSLAVFDRRDAFAGAPDGAAIDYQWRSAHQPGARYAPASFVGGDLSPAAPLAETLAAVDVPVTLVWGRAAERPPLATGQALASAADARLVVVDDAKLLPHDERPAAFRAAVAEELPGLES